MFGKPKKTNVQICRNIDASPYLWCNDARSTVAKLNSDPDLMKTAFQALTLFKNNDDIEQLFID